MQWGFEFESLKFKLNKIFMSCFEWIGSRMHARQLNNRLLQTTKSESCGSHGGGMEESHVSLLHEAS